MKIKVLSWKGSGQQRQPSNYMQHPLEWEKTTQRVLQEQPWHSGVRRASQRMWHLVNSCNCNLRLVLALLVLFPYRNACQSRLCTLVPLTVYHQPHSSPSVFVILFEGGSFQTKFPSKCFRANLSLPINHNNEKIRLNSKMCFQAHLMVNSKKKKKKYLPE